MSSHDRLTRIGLDIDDDAWDEGYDPAEDEPASMSRSKLIATLRINGCLMHLEAFEVIPNSDPQATFVSTEDIDTIAGAVGADGPWETVEIRGREYVLIATPFC